MFLGYNFSMLRRIFAWKYIVAVIAIIGFSVYVSHEDQKTRDQYEKRCTQLSARPITPAAHSEDCDKGADNAARHLPRWYRMFGWPEGITAWAILLTLFAIVEQTSATKDATNAAYGSLTFAEAQFELMKAKERARLDLNVERNDLEVEVAGEHILHLTSTLSIRNVGESKAFVGVLRGILATNLSNQPLEDVGVAMLDLPDRVLEPNKPPIAGKAYCFPEPTALTFAECLENGTYSLHFVGFIEYETMGLWWRKEFGYDWKILNRDSGLGGLYGLSDPYPNSPRPARDRIAYGYWSPNEEKEKPEYPISEPQRENQAN
jgi:hypothetical protein